MGVLTLQFRKMNLIQEQNNIEFQLLDLNQERNKYMDMSSIFANDSVGIVDIASMPASLFGAGMATLSSMHMQATQYANTVMTNMSTNGAFNQFGDKAPQMQYIAYMKAYEQAKEQLKKRIQAQLNKKEKEMDLKKARLEARQTAIDKELEAVNQRLAKDIENSVGHFGLSA